MFTRNFDQLLLGYLTKYVHPSYSTISGDMSDNVMSFKAMTGVQYPITSYPLTWLNGSTTAVTPTSMGTNPTLFLGTNGADEDYDDYNIDPITNIVVDQIRNVSGIENSKPYLLLSKYIRNTSTTTSITVREMGLFTGFSHKSGANSVTDVRVLLYRKKLDEPIIIPPDSVVEARLKFVFERPNKPVVSAEIG